MRCTACGEVFTAGGSRDCPRCGRRGVLRELRPDERRAFAAARERGADPDEAARAVTVRCAR